VSHLCLKSTDNPPSSPYVEPHTHTYTREYLTSLDTENTRKKEVPGQRLKGL
jgi:hypothetical protein